MKRNMWIKYFIGIILILIAVFIGNHILNLIKIDMQKNWTLNYGYLNLISVLSCGVLGSIIGLDCFISERKKQGKWKINLPKIIFISLPSLYFSFALLLVFNGSIPEILVYPIRALISQDFTYMFIFQVILGYSIITSFYKEEE